MSLLRAPPCGRVWAADQRKRNRAPQKTPLSLSPLRPRFLSGESPLPQMEKGEGSVFFGPCCCINAFSIRVEGAKTSCKGLNHITSNENCQKVILCLLGKHCYSCSNSWRRQENADMFLTLFRRLYETHSCPSEPPPSRRPSSVRSRSSVISWPSRNSTSPKNFSSSLLKAGL